MLSRVRYKVIALSLILVIFGVVGTAFVTIRNFVVDKEESVYELNSFAAPNVAAAIGNYVENLTDSLEFVNSMLSSRRRDVRARKRYERWISSLPGLVQVIALNREGKPTFWAVKAGETDRGYDREFLRAVREAPVRGFLKSQKEPVYKMEIAGNTYLAWLSREYFKRFFRFVSAFDVFLLSHMGEAIFSSSSEEGVAAIEQLRSILQKGSKEAVRAKEVAQSGKLFLTAISPIPEAAGSSVVVQAPKSEMALVIQRSTQNSVLFVCGILLVTVILGILFSRRLVQPIEELTHATTRLAQGHWELDLKPKSKDEIGKLVGSFVKLGKDLKLREEQLNDAHAELMRAEKLATLGQFSAGVAHEVKNPLSSILGYAQLAERGLKKGGEKAGDDAQEFLGFIVKETYRASKIISDLLTFARQKSPERKMQPMSNVLEFCVQMVLPQMQEANVKVHFDLGSKELHCPVDRDQIQQVISNLMINAVHAFENNPPEKPKEITVRLKEEGDFASVEIQDTGPGISEENLKKIFEPFFSTKGARKGTGLGLSICHGIIEQHKGRIEVDSTIGEGTTFRLVFPMNERASALKERPKATAPPPQESSPPPA